MWCKALLNNHQSAGGGAGWRSVLPPLLVNASGLIQYETNISTF